MSDLVEIELVNAENVLIRLNRAGDGAKRGLSSGLSAAAIFIASYIKGSLLSGQLVNNVTGNLRRAVFSKLVDPETAMVGVGKEAPYARYVNDGTRPHEIVATNAKALRFMVGGQVMFRKKVNHPGTAPRKFMETGLADTLSDVRRIIIASVIAGARGDA